MKKILTVLAAVALVFTSCTNDVESSTSNASIPKADVVVTATPTSNSPSPTGKNVNRGTIYAWVKDINVTATSNVWNYNTSEIFTLVASGGESLFTIKNVAVGANTFNATTTTSSAQVFSMSNTAETGTIQTPVSLITTMNGHNPYALYNGSKVATIANATINSVEIPMTTPHGRIVSTFVLDPNDAQMLANTNFTVTAQINGQPSNTAITSTKVKNGVAYFEWSNEKSIAGATVTYTIKVYDDTTPMMVLKTYTITVPVQASTSYSCKYVIDRDKVINNADSLTFTWQEWKNVDCADVYDDVVTPDTENPDDNKYNCEGYNSHGYNKNGFNKCGWHKAPNSFYNQNQDKDLSDGDSKAKCQ